MIRRLLFPLLCTALLAGGMVAQLAVDAEPAFAAVPVTDIHVTATSSTSVFGESVTFAASITGPGAVPTGTVDFSDNGDPLCAAAPLTTQPASFAIATCETTDLSVATHAITATYNGDPTYDSEASTDFEPARSHDVTQAATSTELDVDPTATFGAPSSFTANVTPVDPGAGAVTGTVEFQVDGASIGCDSQPLTNGFASCSSAATSGTGTRGITAIYSGDGNFEASSGSASQPLVKAGSTVAVTSSDPQPSLGAAIDYTATFTPVSPATETPDGDTVAFSADGATIDGCETVGISGGVAVCTTTADPRGTVSITAAHAASTNFTASTSPAFVQDVGNLASTTTVSSDDLSSEFNHRVTFTATVAPVASGGPTPSGGTVSFSDGATPLTGCETQTVTAGVATCATSALAVADHTVSADYSGDGGYTSSSSAPITQSVVKAGTTLGVTTDTDPSVYSQSIGLTATLSSPDGPPDGTIDFIIDGNPIVGCSAEAMTAGVATCVTTELSASPGHQVGAQFHATTDYLASDAALFMDTDNADTTTAVTSSNATTSWTAPVTYTATISPTAPATLAPTRGHVAFSLNGDPITACSTQAVTTGTATCAMSTTPVGTNAIAAEFVPADSYNGSTSPDFTQTVAAADTTTAVATSDASTAWGDSVTFTATTSVATGLAAPSTGTTTFSIDGTPVSDCTPGAPTNGVATCTTTLAPIGESTVTAAFVGDADYASSTATGITQTTTAAASTTLVSSSDSTTAWNEPVTFTATVAPVSPATVVPNGGTVAFRSDGATIPGCLTQPVVSGTATCATSSGPVGAFAVTASFSGNTSYASSDSPSILQTVTKAATATALVSDHNPSRSGQAVTLTANVTSTAGVPDGTVSFFQVQKDSSQRLVGSGTLVAGSASMTTDAMTVRIGTIVAGYDGATTFAVSSVTIPQTISRSYSKTLVTSSQKRAMAGRAVTFHVLVASDGDGTGTPTGLVALYRVRANGSRAWIGRGTLHSTGDVLINVSGLPVGSWKIVAEYRGSTAHRTSHRSMTQSIGR